jgi:hypothetical protein
MKRILVIAMLIAAAGCQSAVNPQSTTALPQVKGPVKPTIWEPPPVLASNGSDRTVSYVVTSACDPVPYSPSSGLIHSGSLIPIDFEPNGNPCSYESVAIDANDTSGLQQDECIFHVAGSNVDVINYSNTNCQLSRLANGKWSWTYELISGAKTRLRPR